MQNEWLYGASRPTSGSQRPQLPKIVALTTQGWTVEGLLNSLGKRMAREVGDDCVMLHCYCLIDVLDCHSVANTLKEGHPCSIDRRGALPVDPPSLQPWPSVPRPIWHAWPRQSRLLLVAAGHDSKRA